MAETAFARTNLALINTVQENFIAYHRMFAGLSGITYVDGDITWLITDKGAPGKTVMKTRVADDLIDQRIDETLAEIGQYADHFDWFVFPGCQPDNLGDHLVARSQAGGPDGTWKLHGNIGGPTGTWMIIDLTSLPNAPDVSKDFHVKWVYNLKMLEAWQKINAKGFGSEDYENFFKAYARHGFGPSSTAFHCIGYLADTPVTSATLLIAGGSVSIYNVSTPEAYRRQGFGAAITYATLQEAYQRGHRQVWIWSSAMGRSVYQRVGFIIKDFGIREYQWQRNQID